MTGLENAQHDLSDAKFSLETAIELLDSLDQDEASAAPNLHEILSHLRDIKVELDNSYSQLIEMQGVETH